VEIDEQLTLQGVHSFHLISNFYSTGGAPDDEQVVPGLLMSFLGATKEEVFVSDTPRAGQRLTPLPCQVDEWVAGIRVVQETFHDFARGLDAEVGCRGEEPTVPWPRRPPPSFSDQQEAHGGFAVGGSGAGRTVFEALSLIVARLRTVWKAKGQSRRQLLSLYASSGPWGKLVEMEATG
jgi:hypothetical protein